MGQRIELARLGGRQVRHWQGTRIAMGQAARRVSSSPPQSVNRQGSARVCTSEASSNASQPAIMSNASTVATVAAGHTSRPSPHLCTQPGCVCVNWTVASFINFLTRSIDASTDTRRAILPCTRTSGSTPFQQSSPSARSPRSAC